MSFFDKTEPLIIRRSKSLYGALEFFAPKKDSKLRLCIEYHWLYRQTPRDCYPTPTATDLIARTRGARMFSKLDLHSLFHQLRICDGDHIRQLSWHQEVNTNQWRVHLAYLIRPAIFSASWMIFCSTSLPQGIVCAIVLTCWFTQNQMTLLKISAPLTIFETWLRLDLVQFRAAVIATRQPSLRSDQHWWERDCFHYIIIQTYDVGLYSRRHSMEFDAGTRPFTSFDAPNA